MSFLSLIPKGNVPRVWISWLSCLLRKLSVVPSVMITATWRSFTPRWHAILKCLATGLPLSNRISRRCCTTLSPRRLPVWPIYVEPHVMHLIPYMTFLSVQDDCTTGLEPRGKFMLSFGYKWGMCHNDFFHIWPYSRVWWVWCGCGPACF